MDQYSTLLYQKLFFKCSTSLHNILSNVFLTLEPDTSVQKKLIFPPIIDGLKSLLPWFQAHVNTRLIETSIHMCWASWGGRIPPNAVGGNIPLASGTLLYNQHNTNSTQNTQPHTTTNHNKMTRHRARSARASTTAHSPPVSAPVQFTSSPHHGRRRACSVL